MKKIMSIIITSFSLLACVPDTLIWEVTPIGSTNDNAPEYTFGTAVFGPISYGGSCSSSQNYINWRGIQTVTLDPLPDGTYSDCTITITDAGDKQYGTETLEISSFTIGAAEPTTFWYPDIDRDNFGDEGAEATVSTLAPDEFWVADNTDCNDSNPAINPSALELYDDDIDNNCDGVIARCSDLLEINACFQHDECGWSNTTGSCLAKPSLETPCDQITTEAQCEVSANSCTWLVGRCFFIGA